MKVEEKWENPGRDKISLEELLDLYAEGYEFVLGDGHIMSVVMQL